MHRKAVALFVFVLILAALAAVFVVPKGFGSRFLPWRLGLDLVGGSHLVYEVDMAGVASEDRNSVMDGLRDVIERRVNLFGVSEPQVLAARSGDSYRLIVELAGIKDVASAIKEIGETPFLVFAEVTAPLPNPKAAATTSPAASLAPTKLTGRYVQGARLVFDQFTGKAQISLEFNPEGAKLFEEITSRNVGKQVAVLLDGAVITAPVVQEKITGGRAQITGSFTPNEAKEIVARFNAGALPAPIKLVAQETVDASLGAQSLEKTLKAGAIGTAIVILFMLLYYRTFGAYASGALLIYAALVLGIFKLFTVTMTLSGIAGIILSIGMAVDANILIFERTKEEVRRGMARTAAVEEGFRRAWPSIRDSNITTIITSLILYFFSTGFVKGFALALLIGVIVSMFSAITVTRTIMRAFTRSPKP